MLRHIISLLRLDILNCNDKHPEDTTTTTTTTTTTDITSNNNNNNNNNSSRYSAEVELAHTLSYLTNLCVSRRQYLKALPLANEAFKLSVKHYGRIYHVI
jgi:hypothetical protein